MSPGAQVLPDLLDHGCKVVFCGSAAGARSAAVGAYYAGPGNRFWPVLHRVGLTPRELAPHEFAEALDYRIGLTDLAKRESGADAELSAAAYDSAGFEAKMSRYAPSAVAFNGKAPARAYFGGAALDYGRQAARIGAAAVFVLPSTSGAARRYWDQSHWWALAEFVRSRP
ncbi:MAG: mismatch-specific DNA-glycosylase [Alphaproteobacteria bacterium]|nr:mismatch-specific DNA-glycosylase [Alphaproteobacteria bacterium]